MSSLRAFDDSPPAARQAAEATRGSAIKLAAEGLGRSLGIIASLLVVRALSPADFGIYSVLTGVALIASEFGEMGLQATASRALVAGSLSLRLFLRTRAFLGTLLLSITLAFVLATPTAGASGEGTWSTVAAHAALLLPFVLYFHLSGWSEFLGVSLRARSRPASEGVTILTFRAAGLLAVLAVMARAGGLRALAWGLAASTLPAVVLGALLLRGTRPPATKPPEASDVLGLVRLAFPLGVNGLLTLACLQVERTMVLPIAVSEETVGHFAAALKLVESLILVPSAISAGAMPALTREALHGSGPVRARTALTAALLGVPAAVGLALLAAPVVALVYLPEYAASARPLQILAFALVPLFLNNVLLNALNACGRGALLPRLTAARLFVALGLAVVLIPAFGAEGAAFGFLSSESLLLPLAARACRRAGFAVPVARSLALAVALSLPMAAAVALTPGGPLLRIAVGALTYAVSVAAAWRLRLLGALA
jgi:O-antigen/teichoic acid export membrane protein